MHPEFSDIVTHSSEVTQNVSITTNGSICNPKQISLLAEAKSIYLIISLDGPNAKIHDHIRQFEGSFDRIEKLANTCREFSLQFGINITVGKFNAPHVYETLLFGASIGANDISVSLVKPEGRGTPSDVESTDLVCVANQVERAKEVLYGQCLVQFTEPLNHVFDVSLVDPRFQRSCGAGGASLHVQCSGDVLICTSCTQSLGNLDKVGSQIGELWENDSRLNAIRKGGKLGGICGDCSFRNSCGGCRCRAEKSDGFLFGDPLCPKVKNDLQSREISPHVAKAVDRISPSASKDPNKLRNWLKEWNSGQTFSRSNPNFTSLKRWGHDYDLQDGTKLHGEMGNRHIRILTKFLESGSLSADLTDSKILDVGPWTGGEALLLAALGANVDFVEEHPEHAKVTSKLAHFLNLPVKCIGKSLYDISQKPEQNYDVVYLSGIFSHLTDPIVALKIILSLLREGGVCLLETQTSYRQDGQTEYWGPQRQGWVWWNVSRNTLLSMLYDTGFEKISLVDFDENRRILLSAKKSKD